MIASQSRNDDIKNIQSILYKFSTFLSEGQRFYIYTFYCEIYYDKNEQCILTD